MEPIQLPGGYYDADGLRHRTAELVPLRGREEELLIDRSQPAATQVTRILERCAHVQGIGPLDTEMARSLAVGDRQFLLMKLREITLGPEVQAVAACPWWGCSQRVNVDFSLAEVPVRDGLAGPVHTMQLSEEAAAVTDDGERHRHVEFRLPNGGDQEALAQLAMANQAAALSALLHRCLVAVGPARPPTQELVDRLTARARLEIEEAIAAAAPGPELTMEARCPACGRAFGLPFEIQDFFFGDLHDTADLLYREVHYLAYHYHWSEAEILGLTRDKRRHYINVLAEEIERINDGLD
jgi:Family of unknown function (DUF6760)